jgi:hypothetical protein
MVWGRITVLLTQTQLAFEQGFLGVFHGKFQFETGVCQLHIQQVARAGHIWTLFLKMVGTSRCDVPARVSAGGTKVVERVRSVIRFRRLTLRSATGIGAARRPYPRTVSRYARTGLDAKIHPGGHDPQSFGKFDLPARLRQLN